ncbi:MAG: PorP/SprF family type IX secretion system membrane protein [Ferruginibacter sp.]
MKKPILHFIVPLLVMSCQNATSQDIHFSQIFETPLLRNPSLAGLFAGDVRVQSVYRSQWSSVTVPYQTTSLSGEFKKPVGNSNDFITIGGQVLYDKAGTIALTSTHILPTMNYHKSMGSEKNTYLSLGFMGGYVQRSIDRSKITTNSQYDGTGFNPDLSDGEKMAKSSYSYFDATVGMSFNSQIGENTNNNLFAGLAYHHFNKAKKITYYSDGTSEMIPKIIGSAGVRMSMSNFSYFTLQTDYSSQGPHKEMITGVLYSYKLDDTENPKYSLHMGAYLRWKDAVIPVAKVECRPLAIAVSYDANISQLKTGSNGRGGFEVSLTFQKYKQFNSSSEAVRCPRF